MIMSLLSVGIIRCGAYILYEFPAILYAGKLLSAKRTTSESLCHTSRMICA